MKDFLKNKVVTIVIVIATILLAGVAIFTAIRLYQLRQEAVAPTAPESKPAAQTAPAPTYESCQSLAFTITQQEGTPTPTASATPTAPPGEETPAPTTTAGPTEAPTTAPTSPPIGGDTEAPIAPATGEPTLPDAGIATPTLFGIGAGIILLIISLALAL